MDTRREDATALAQRLADREKILLAEDEAKSAAADLRSILRVPHQPFSCSIASETEPDTGPRRHCAAAVKRTSRRCNRTPAAGKRLCGLHAMQHSSVDVFLKKPWLEMEASRRQLDKLAGSQVLFLKLGPLKDYVRKVNKFAHVMQIHQQTYSCKSECQ